MMTRGGKLDEGSIWCMAIIWFNLQPWSCGTCPTTGKVVQLCGLDYPIIPERPLIPLSFPSCNRGRDKEDLL